MPESEDERSARNARAAHIRWSRIPPSERRTAAKLAQRRRHEARVDPDRKLSASDRAELVAQSIAADMAEMRWRRLKKQRGARDD